MRQFILLLLFLGFEHLGIGRRPVLGLLKSSSGNAALITRPVFSTA
jgi:hypothetical protein